VTTEVNQMLGGQQKNNEKKEVQDRDDWLAVPNLFVSKYVEERSH